MIKDINLYHISFNDERADMYVFHSDDNKRQSLTYKYFLVQYTNHLTTHIFYHTMSQTVFRITVIKNRYLTGQREGLGRPVP